MDSRLQEVYKDPSQSCNSRDTLWERCKQLGIPVSRRDCQRFLDKQESYQLHRQIRKPKNVAPVIATKPLSRVQIDLTGPWPDGHLNSGYTYVMSIVDVFSRYAWLIPLKDKSGAEVAGALDKWLASLSVKPLKVQTDNGSEFKAEFNAVLAKYNIQHIYSSVYSPTSQSIVERFNKTFKHIVYALMTQRESKVWYLLLSPVVKNYNQRIHDTLQMTPEQAFSGTGSEELLKQYREHAAAVLRTHSKPQEIAVGDTVRVRLEKHGISAKGYTPSWTKQLFTVTKVRGGGRPMVQLQGAEGWYHIYNVQKVDTSNLVNTTKVPTGPREQVIAEIASRRRAGQIKTVYQLPATTMQQDRQIAKQDAPVATVVAERVTFANFNLQHLWNKLESLRKGEILRIFDAEFSGSASSLQGLSSGALKEYVRRKLRKLAEGKSTHIKGHGTATLQNKK